MSALLAAVQLYLLHEDLHTVWPSATTHALMREWEDRVCALLDRVPGKRAEVEHDGRQIEVILEEVSLGRDRKRYFVTKGGTIQPVHRSPAHVALVATPWKRGIFGPLASVPAVPDHKHKRITDGR